MTASKEYWVDTLGMMSPFDEGSLYDTLLKTGLKYTVDAVVETGFGKMQSGLNDWVDDLGVETQFGTVTGSRDYDPDLDDPRRRLY